MCNPITKFLATFQQKIFSAEKRITDKLLEWVEQPVTQAYQMEQKVLPVVHTVADPARELTTEKEKT